MELYDKRGAGSAEILTTSEQWRIWICATYFLLQIGCICGVMSCSCMTIVFEKIKRKEWGIMRWTRWSAPNGRRTTFLNWLFKKKVGLDFDFNFESWESIRNLDGTYAGSAWYITPFSTKGNFLGSPPHPRLHPLTHHFFISRRHLVSPALASQSIVSQLLSSHYWDHSCSCKIEQTDKPKTRFSRAFNILEMARAEDDFT